MAIIALAKRASLLRASSFVIFDQRQQQAFFLTDRFQTLTMGWERRSRGQIL